MKLASYSFTKASGYTEGLGPLQTLTYVRAFLLPACILCSAMNGPAKPEPQASQNAVPKRQDPKPFDQKPPAPDNVLTLNG